MNILNIIDEYLKLILISWPAVILILSVFILIRHKEAIDNLIRRIKSINKDGLDTYGPSGSEPIVPELPDSKLTNQKHQKDKTEDKTNISKNGVARVFYKITSELPNSVSFNFSRDHKVWFWIFNYDPKQYLAYIKVKFITNNFEKESESDYYGGLKAWRINEYSGIQAPGLDFPEEIKNAVKRGEKINLEIRCKIHDDVNNFIEEKLPQNYAYDPENNSWFLEP